MTQGNTVDAGKLTEFSAKALQKMGVPENDALITARMLVSADLRGVDSHGVAHLAPFYIKRIKDGLINVNPDIKVFSNAASTAIMDGDEGLGFVVGYRAMEEAMQRAGTTGSGLQILTTTGLWTYSRLQTTGRLKRPGRTTETAGQM